MSKSRRVPPHLQDYCDKRDGGRYLYFRKPGHKRVRLPLPIGSEEFWAANKAAIGNKINVGAAGTSAGSISAAIAAYYAASAWHDDLSPGIRVLRRPILEHFRARYGTWPLRQLTENFLVAYLESLKPHAARNHLTTLRGLLRHAKYDVTAQIKAPKAKSAKHASWPADVIAQYEAHHAIGTKARLCFALGKYTGAGRTEISRIAPQHVKDSVIEIPARQKTGAPGTLLLHPEPRAIIDATPITGTKTLLVNQVGKRCRPNNLTDQFRVQRGGNPGAIQHSRSATRHGRHARRARRQSERDYRRVGPRQRQDGDPLHARRRPQESAADRQHEWGTFWQH